MQLSAHTGISILFQQMSPMEHFLIPWNFLMVLLITFVIPVFPFLGVGLLPFPRRCRGSQLLTAYVYIDGLYLAGCPCHYSMHIGYNGNSVAIQVGYRPRSWRRPPCIHSDQKRRDSGILLSPRWGAMVCNKGYRFSVTLLIPQGFPRQVSFHSECHAPPCGRHRPRSRVPEGKDA